MSHIPVLLNEVITLLQPKAGDTVIDATLGGGGHAKAILKLIGPKGKLLGIDADPQAVENFNKHIGHKNAKAVQGNFREIKRLAEESAFDQTDAVLFDLGISSDQLDDPDRGFSFQKSGALDMRLDRAAERSAHGLINRLDENELSAIIREFGEERNAKKIARAIVVARKQKPVSTTDELFELIKLALPGAVRFKAGDVARRTFQALRIAVNRELEALPQGLKGAFSLLRPGGRMAVISFHSLEDRLVKNYFAELCRDCVCPPEFPVCICARRAEAKPITGKPVVPGEKEQKENTIREA